MDANGKGVPTTVGEKIGDAWPEESASMGAVSDSATFAAAAGEQLEVWIDTLKNTMAGDIGMQKFYLSKAEQYQGYGDSGMLGLVSDLLEKKIKNIQTTLAALSNSSDLNNTLDLCTRGLAIDNQWQEEFRTLRLQSETLYTDKEIGALMVGFKAAGKTTILKKLGPVTIPAVGLENAKYKNICITAWDLGGDQDKIRPLWKNTQALVFVVDSTDRDRIVEGKDQLHKMLNEDELRDAILLVFANKQDHSGSMNAEEITDKLGLRSIRQRLCYVQGTCATSGDSLYKALDWLSNNTANEGNQRVNGE